MSGDALRMSLTQLMDARSETAKVLTKINAIHDKCRKKNVADVQIPAKLAVKLRDLYGQAATLSAREGWLAGEAISAAAAVTRPAGSNSKRKGADGGYGSASKRQNSRAAAQQQHPFPNQAMVAVKTAKGDGGETKPHVRGEPEQWILGSVARYISSLGYYDIVDAGEESNTVTRLRVPASDVVRLPEEWESSLAFQKEERVLALFPETTEFYMATVSSSAKRRKERDYVLAFDDDEVPTRIVSFNYVLQI